MWQTFSVPPPGKATVEQDSVWSAACATRGPTENVSRLMLKLPRPAAIATFLVFGIDVQAHEVEVRVRNDGPQRVRADVPGRPLDNAQSGHDVFPSVSLARIERTSSVANDCSSAAMA